MRPNKPMWRASAVTAAAGVLALCGPVLPAGAQDSAEPPPLDNSATPTQGQLTELPGPYEQQQSCMRSNPGSATIEEKPWSQLTLGFEQAHDQGLTGKNQTIAIIDTGINSHPRLPPINTSGGSNVPDGGGAGKDCDGHGTVVAGIAAASQSPQTGFVGIAPNSSLMSLRQSSDLWQHKDKGNTIGDTETMAQAVEYAWKNDADVINISQSSCQPISQASNPNDQYNKQLHNAVENAYQAGTVVVVAAGNVDKGCQQNPAGDPTTAVLPAWFDDYVLTVASVNQQGAPSEFTVAGPWVDVAAPGENLISLDPGQGGNGLASQLATGPDNQPAPIQGTSFAAPYVSGLVALLKERYPDMRPEQIMDRIKETALHPGGDSGRNDSVGYGMINPMAALNNIVPAEYNAEGPPKGPTRLGADVIPEKNWPAILVAFGGSLGGIGAVVFTAFLVNAVRAVKTRQSGSSEQDQL